MNDFQHLNLALVISSLSAGGAERVISTMANYWAEKGMKITLITLSTTKSDFYDLCPEIKRIGLGVMTESINPLEAIRNNIHCLQMLRSAIKSSNPDAIVSFMDRMNVLVLLASRGLAVKVIVSERIYPALHTIGKIWNRLRRMCYPWADAVIIQSNQSIRWLESINGIKSAIVIPNPVIKSSEDRGNEVSLLNMIGQPATTKIVVAMGRLDRQKGFDLLIRAFAKAACSNSEWQLVILGEGVERNALVMLARTLGVAERVHLPGRVKRPRSVMKEADFFVLSSRYEGFPNALLEAMACGLPVISSDCLSGPGEIIRNGVDGLLVPAEDVTALAGAMFRLISDEKERMRLAVRAPDIIARFSLEKIMGMWDEALESVLPLPSKRGSVRSTADG